MLIFYYKFKLIIDKLSDDYRKRKESGEKAKITFSFLAILTISNYF